MTNVVIVGADRGIGAAMANIYHRRGDTTIAVCLEGGTELIEAVRVVPDIDVTDDDAVQRLATALTDCPIDVLVHVAGRGSFDRWGQFDYAQMLARQRNPAQTGRIRELVAEAQQAADLLGMVRLKLQIADLIKEL